MVQEREKISLFRSFFRGRDDIVPMFWHSPKSGKSGYTPVCRNEWRQTLCRKGRAGSACSSCPHADYVPFSAPLLRAHFQGRHILGLYPLLADHHCNLIAADFDNHSGNCNPVKDMRNYYEICRFQEIPCHVLRSKSGTGFHAYIFFSKAVPAAKARCIANALLEEAEVRTEEFSAFDRLFPAQDQLSGKGFGNLIALPFQGQAAKKGHTLFLNPDTDFRHPCTDQWEYLQAIRKTDEAELDEILIEWKLEWKPGRKTEKNGNPVFPYHERNPAKRKNLPLADFERIARFCPFIAHCRDNARILPEPDWYILLTISARCGDGLRLSHCLSAPYPRYSRKETDVKIRRALTCTGPYCCRTISEINGRYCKECSFYGKIRSPIVLGRGAERH